MIPRRYRGVSFDRPPVPSINPMAVRMVRTYCEQIDQNLAGGRGMWLMGDVGTGKTTLAMLISKAAIESGHSVVIYSAPKLLARVRQTFDDAPGEDSYLQLFSRLATVDLLHIDDLGAEKRSDWVTEQLYALINERYEGSRPVLITSNTLAVDDGEIGRALARLEQELSPRTVSRLLEMCGGDPVPMFGNDLRLAS